MTVTLEKTDKNTHKNDDLALYEDLERRFGPAMAQQIVDELKKTEQRDNGTAPSFINYMAAKALSEAAELYRRETQAALRRYKNWKVKCGTASKDIVDMECVVLKKEVQSNFHFYRRFNKGFYTVYRQAMQTYKTGTHVHYKTNKVCLDKAWNNTAMAIAA